ncbi:immunoglobulin I-set domain protein [Ostertagia ostertagi]
MCCHLMSPARHQQHKSFTRIDAFRRRFPTIKLGDRPVAGRQPLRLECKVEGSPLPELTWNKDGVQIQSPDRQYSFSNGSRMVLAALLFHRVVGCEGIYRVIATNPSGTVHDKGTATIKKAPRDRERSAERDEFDANKVPRIPEKQGFRLRCKFSGEPKLSIKWFKDGERVFPYGRLKLVRIPFSYRLILSIIDCWSWKLITELGFLQLESPDGVCELVIESSIRQDAGGYRCVAENAYGAARTTCDVTVIQKERKPITDFDATMKEGKAPGFTVPLTIRRAKPGADVTFECVPYGNPFPQIRWLKVSTVP